MSDKRTIFVVDDDAELRESIEALVTSLGYGFRGFGSGESFLDEYSPSMRGVLVLDLRMPGMGGLHVLKAVVRQASHIPVIILTAFARTEVIVKALHAGAMTAIDKPYHDDDLWDAIRLALEQEEMKWSESERRQKIRKRIESLTEDEDRVCELIVAGHANKVIAQQTGLALRTVEKRRHNIFVKLQVDSVAQLVALFLESRS